LPPRLLIFWVVKELYRPTFGKRGTSAGASLGDMVSPHVLLSSSQVESIKARALARLARPVGPSAASEDEAEDLPMGIAAEFGARKSGVHDDVDGDDAGYMCEKPFELDSSVLDVLHTDVVGSADVYELLGSIAFMISRDKESSLWTVTCIGVGTTDKALRCSSSPMARRSPEAVSGYTAAPEVEAPLPSPQKRYRCWNERVAERDIGSLLMMGWGPMLAETSFSLKDAFPTSQEKLVFASVRYRRCVRTC